MKKAKKMFVVSIAICLFGILSVSAASLYQNINTTAKMLSAWKELDIAIKQTTTDTSSVSLDSMGGASSLGFRARGQWYDHTNWHWTNYGPTSTVTMTGTLNVVYFSQDFSESMRVALSLRNNNSNLTMPRVVGVWNHR